MKGCSFLLGGLLFVANPMAFAADPAFKDFSITSGFTGVNHELVPQENSSPKMEHARAQALQGKVNFAGHYILHKVGCGGSAVCGEVLDARTGDVAVGLPNAYDGDTFSLSYQPGSRLLIISGITADTEEDVQGRQLESSYRVRYYEFVNNEFRLLTIKDS